MALETIERRPRASSVVADQIRQAILTGNLEDGQALPLAEVAQQLGVSMMPVREALISLAGEGLVADHGRRGGYRVTALSEQDLADISELHAFIQSALAARAAANISADQIAHLRELQEEMQLTASKRHTKKTSAKLQDLNDQFHGTINRSSPSDMFRIFLRSTLKFMRQDAYLAFPDWADRTIADHPAIVDALEAGDSELAARLMHDHITGATHLRGCGS